MQVLILMVLQMIPLLEWDGTVISTVFLKRIYWPNTQIKKFLLVNKKDWEFRSETHPKYLSQYSYTALTAMATEHVARIHSEFHIFGCSVLSP